MAPFRRSSRAYAGQVIGLSPLMILYRDQSYETNVESWRVKLKIGRIPPPPWGDVTTVNSSRLRPPASSDKKSSGKR